MSEVARESVSALWFVYQKSYVRGACGNVFSPLESLFFKRVGGARVTAQDCSIVVFQVEASSLIFLAQGDVCSLISNCHFPCRKVL